MEAVKVRQFRPHKQDSLVHQHQRQFQLGRPNRPQMLRAGNVKSASCKGFNHLRDHPTCDALVVELYLPEDDFVKKKW